MAQGSGGSKKLAKKAKSGGSQKRQLVRGKKTSTKGPRDCKPRSHHSAAAEMAATTKAINQKNEVAIAAKAVSVGTKFFLSDVAAKGEKEMKKQLRARDKKNRVVVEEEDPRTIGSRRNCGNWERMCNSRCCTVLAQDSFDWWIVL